MQLFTHLLSSYLQGMGDFFSALPKEEGAPYKPHPNLPQGEGTPASPILTFPKGKEKSQTKAPFQPFSRKGA